MYMELPQRILVCLGARSLHEVIVLGRRDTCEAFFTDLSGSHVGREEVRTLLDHRHAQQRSPRWPRSITFGLSTRWREYSARLDAILGDAIGGPPRGVDLPLQPNVFPAPRWSHWTTSEIPLPCTVGTRQQGIRHTRAAMHDHDGEKSPTSAPRI